MVQYQLIIDDKCIEENGCIYVLKNYTSHTSAINWLINVKGTLEILKLGFKITSTPCFLRPGKPMYVIYTKESKQYPLD